MKYPKIQTLWKRDENNKFVIMEGKYSKPEFENIKNWSATEKIDGTNIRIYISKMEEGSPIKITFHGRTDNAQIPTFLFSYLQGTFTPERCECLFSSPTLITLYGEGYGPKIQKGGGNYRDDVSFILFDVLIGNWWLDRDKVCEIAQQLSINHVPVVYQNTDINIVQKYIKENPDSLVNYKRKIEGLVCQPNPLMLFRDGTPIKFKLKVEDYIKLDKFGGSQ